MKWAIRSLPSYSSALLMMKNPWETIPLSTYEQHMRLASVGQLQALNRMMKQQFASFPVTSIMILGIAGGNGLEHIHPNAFQKIYGIDVNPEYLTICQERFSYLGSSLECSCMDLTQPSLSLPHAELLIADLLIEYIGYDSFKRVITQVAPMYISCIVQINPSSSFVSDSPYLASFDALSNVHVQIEETALDKAMSEAQYQRIARTETALPNGKSLVQLDYHLHKE